MLLPNNFVGGAAAPSLPLPSPQFQRLWMNEWMNTISVEGIGAAVRELNEVYANGIVCDLEETNALCSQSLGEH